MTYATLDEIRNLDGLGDRDVHSDASIATSIAIAKEVIDKFTGTSFGSVESPAFDSFESTVDGSGTTIIRLLDEERYPVMFVRSIDTVTIDGIEDDTSTFKIRDHAGYISTDSSFPRDFRNIVVTGTAGRSNTPSAGIRWAARSIARYWLLNLHSRVPDRALNLTTAEGAYEVRAQAGGVGRPTAMPDVNAELNRHRHSFAIG